MWISATNTKTCPVTNSIFINLYFFIYVVVVKIMKLSYQSHLSNKILWDLDVSDTIFCSNLETDSEASKSK